MEDPIFPVLQVVLVLSVIAGLVSWVLRSLLCQAQHDAAGKVVLVTGCDTGIGHELARHMDTLGFTVFAGCLDTASEGAQRLRVEASPRLTLVNMDVRSEEHVRQAVRFMEENMPQGEEGLYGLVNNAGVCVCGEFDWQTMCQIKTQVDVNLLGPMRVTKQCLPLLKAGRGRVVNVSSVAGLQGYPGLSTYCATKFGMEGFSEVLRLELAKFGVSVVTVQPGDYSKATRLLDNHHRNMNIMWGEMSEDCRRQYRDFFLAYHDNVAKSGFTGQRIKPLSVLPLALIRGFERAMLTVVPDKSYLLLPSWGNQIKMRLVNLMPGGWGRRILANRYNKSVPKVDLSSSRSTLNTIVY